MNERQSRAAYSSSLVNAVLRISATAQTLKLAASLFTQDAQQYEKGGGMWWLTFFSSSHYLTPLVLCTFGIYFVCATLVRSFSSRRAIGWLVAANIFTYVAYLHVPSVKQRIMEGGAKVFAWAIYMWWSMPPNSMTTLFAMAVLDVVTFEQRGEWFRNAILQHSGIREFLRWLSKSLPHMTLVLILAICAPYYIGAATTFHNSITQSGRAETEFEALWSQHGETYNKLLNASKISVDDYDSKFILSWVLASRNPAFVRAFGNGIGDLGSASRELKLTDLPSFVASKFIHNNAYHLGSNVKSLFLIGALLEYKKGSRFLAISAFVAGCMNLAFDLIVIWSNIGTHHAPGSLSPQWLADRWSSPQWIIVRWSALFGCGFSGIICHLAVLLLLDRKLYVHAAVRLLVYNSLLAIVLLDIEWQQQGLKIHTGHAIGILTGVLQKLVA